MSVESNDATLATDQLGVAVMKVFKPTNHVRRTPKKHALACDFVMPLRYSGCFSSKSPLSTSSSVRVEIPSFQLVVLRFGYRIGTVALARREPVWLVDHCILGLFGRGRMVSAPPEGDRSVSLLKGPAPFRVSEVPKTSTPPLNPKDLGGATSLEARMSTGSSTISRTSSSSWTSVLDPYLQLVVGPFALTRRDLERRELLSFGTAMLASTRQRSTFNVQRLVMNHQTENVVNLSMECSRRKSAQHWMHRPQSLSPAQYNKKRNKPFLG